MQQKISQSCISSRALVIGRNKCQNGGKCDLSVTDYGIVIGARWVGLSLLETADLLGFSNTNICLKIV